MEFIKKNRFALLIFFLLLSAYLFLRLYNLTSLPIFTDEAIYIRWSQIAGTDANWRFISLTDGKQPMYVWIAMVLLRLLKDPLFAGRLVSVIAGFFSMVGIFFLTLEIFKDSNGKYFSAKKLAFLASFIYLIYPFALVYDRLALYDSLVALFIIWSLYFEILLVRHVRLDLGMILGMIIGGGMLTKTNASFAMILLPASLLLFDFKDKNYRKKLGLWAIFAVISIIIALVIYSVLRLSPFFHIIAQKNYTFIYTPKEILLDPFSHFFGNLKGMSTWLIGYMTIPFIVLVISSFLVGKKHFREKLLLLAWFIVPFGALALFGRTIYPRFILFMTMPLLVLGAYAFFHLVSFSKNFWLRTAVVFVFLISFLINDFFIVTDFAKASVPQGDREQLITAWASGGGVKETVNFLEKKSKNEKIYVGTEGTFGLMPYALEIYLKDNPNIITEGFWPIGDQVPKKVLDNAKKMPTYFVFYQPCSACSKIGVAPAGWPLAQIFQIQKMEKDTHYTLYKVEPQ